MEFNRICNGVDVNSSSNKYNDLKIHSEGTNEEKRGLFLANSLVEKKETDRCNRCESMGQ